MDRYGNVMGKRRLFLVWSCLRMENDSTITGYKLVKGWGPERHIYFADTFSRKLTGLCFMQDGKPVVYNTSRFRSCYEAWEKNLMACISFDTKAGEEVIVKTAISAVSTNGAKNNLREPWKCQKWVRTIAERFYGDTPDALSGNDDCGQMSAWYMFNCIGFYPVAPSSNIYNIGSPCVEAITVRMSNGKLIEMTTENWSPENVYVKELYVNGKKYGKSCLRYEDVCDGVKLRFVMSN